MEAVKKTMEDFIKEASVVGLENIERRKELCEKLVKTYQKRNYKNICIVASGSSGNACQMAKYYVERMLRCRVDVVSPFTFEHHEHLLSLDTMYVVVSQSGYSTNAIAALVKVKKQGLYAIGMSGDRESDLVQYCDLFIDYGVGVESIGYVTKGVVTLCLYWQLFAVESAINKGDIDEETYENALNELKKAMHCNAQMYEASKLFYEQNRKVLLSMPHVYVCSNGANLGTACEGALKIGETVQIPSFAYEIEEYIHGPNLQLTPNYPIFFIDNNDETSDRIYEIFKATCSVSDKVFLLSNKYEDKNCIRISDSTSSEVSPLYNVVFFQYLAYQITQDLHRWKKHPLFDDFEKMVQCKSDNYQNSPLASEDE